MTTRSGQGGTNFSFALPTADTDVLWAGSANLPATSTLALDINQIWRTNTSVLAGDGTLAVDATVSFGATAWQGTSVLAATSTLAVNADIAAWKFGIYDETGATGNLDLGVGRYTEFEFGLAIDPDTVKAGDVLTFKLYANGADIDAYAQTVTVTVPAHEINAAISIGGVSSLALDATLAAGAGTWQGTALLVPASILSATASLALRAVAAFAAGSSLAFDTKRYQLATATLAATSSLAADSKRYVTATALLIGASVLAVDTKPYLVATSTLADTGAATISVNATIAGQVTVWQGTTVLVGATTLLANTIQTHFVSPALVATSVLAATASIALTGKSQWPIASVLTVNANRWQTATALLVAGSTLSVDTKRYQYSTAVLAGTSILSALPWQLLVARGTLPLASTLDTFATIAGAVTAWQGSTVLIGSATIAADSTQWLVASTAAAGSTTLTVNALRYVPATATLSGTSTLATDLVIRGKVQGTAVLAATGTLAAVGTLLLPAAAVLTGSSALAINAVQRFAWQDSALLAATSTLAADSRYRLAALAKIDGASSLAATVRMRALASSRLDAAGRLMADTFAFGASEIHQEFTVVSGFRVDAFRAKRNWRRRTPLQGSVVVSEQHHGSVSAGVELRGRIGRAA